MYTYDLDTQQWRPRRHSEAEGPWQLLWSPDRRSRLLQGRDAWTLVDPSDATIATIEGRWASFLPDGRIVAHAGREIVLHDGSGARLRSYPAPAREITRPMVPREGWIAFGVIPAGEPDANRGYLLNLETGEMREAMRADRPIRAHLGARTAPGSFASHLHLDAKRALVHFDPFTGETRVLGGPRS